MSVRTAALFLFAFAFPVSAIAEEKSDQKKIQGKWKMESGQQGGKPLPEAMVKSGTLVVDGNKMKMAVSVEGQEKTHELTFKLDPSQKPRAIDVEINGKPGLGIYSLEGDTLKICAAQAGSKDRPTDLTAKAGSDRLLIVLKKEKAK